jgi:Protein of unknown function (DUF3106)
LVGILEQVSAAQSKASGTAAAAGFQVMMKTLVICSCLFVAATTVSYAQNPQAPATPAPAPREWQSLSAEQQHLLQNYQGKWNSLPPDKQEALSKGSQRWLSMSPEQRSGAQQRFSQWRAMPPEQRQELRQRWQQFKSLPPEQQQRVRESFQRFRQMPPERRQELRRQWHQMSPEQRRNFTHRAPLPAGRPRGR